MRSEMSAAAVSLELDRVTVRLFCDNMMVCVVKKFGTTQWKGIVRRPKELETHQTPELIPGKQLCTFVAVIYSRHVASSIVLHRGTLGASIDQGHNVVSIVGTLANLFDHRSR